MAIAEQAELSVREWLERALERSLMRDAQPREIPKEVLKLSDRVEPRFKK